jgi:uncharacterized protein (DUF488 family)
LQSQNACKAWHKNEDMNKDKWNIAISKAIERDEINEEKSLSDALFASNMMLSLDVLIDIKHKAQTMFLVLFGQAQTLILSY